MPHAQLVAEKLAEGMKIFGVKCQRRNNQLLIQEWYLTITVHEGQEEIEASSARIFPTIICSNLNFPHGFARELGVGIGKDLRDAVSVVSGNWIMLFFPLLKYLFEDNPHDCMVLESGITPANSFGQRYTLCAGPLQTHGFAADARAPRQETFWTLIADLLLPKLSPGVHHIRCFAAKMENGTRADLFIDGVKSEEASQRLIEWAEGFPALTRAEPVHACKQQILIRPDNLDLGMRQAEDFFITQWTAAVTPRVTPAHKPWVFAVVRTLYAMSYAVSKSQMIDKLKFERLEATTIDELMSFIPSAAARIILGDRLEFAPSYFLCNRSTQRARKVRYDQTPAFTSSLEILQILSGAQLALEEIELVANDSAEMHSAQQAYAAQGTLAGARFTEIIHSTDAQVAGPHIDELTRPN